MPVTPPPADEFVQFDPVYVTDEDLDDLATFTGMSKNACLERLRRYSSSELARQWRHANPVSADEILRFYATTESYIWALMQWHASAARAAYWKALEYFVGYYAASAGWPQVYDFGCGVGTDALFLTNKGYAVTAVDVPGPTLEFARHRFRRRGWNCKFVESTSQVPRIDSRYDAAVCFDVFEHLPRPLEAVKALVAALTPHGVLIQQASFTAEDAHPCHLADGVREFGGLRWHIQLAGLGLRSTGPMTYVKVANWAAAVQRARYAIWRLSGLWLVRA